jgi:hypothetical protein
VELMELVVQRGSNSKSGSLKTIEKNKALKVSVFFSYFFCFIVIAPRTRMIVVLVFSFQCSCF